MVKINGVEQDVAGMKLSAYLTLKNYIVDRIAVEKNGNIVPKSHYDSTVLCDGDFIEIVSFVGGG